MYVMSFKKDLNKKVVPNFKFPFIQVVAWLLKSIYIFKYRKFFEGLPMIIVLQYVLIPNKPVF